MRVLLVRHAQSRNNAIKDENTDDYFDRRESDPNLTDFGI